MKSLSEIQTLLRKLPPEAATPGVRQILTELLENLKKLEQEVQRLTINQNQRPSG